jgi:hypothetical protein
MLGEPFTLELTTQLVIFPSLRRLSQQTIADTAEVRYHSAGVLCMWQAAFSLAAAL